MSSNPTSSAYKSTVNRYILEIIVFTAGAAVMIFELVGSRIFAPYLGTSLYIWTSLIGVILGSLSIGYWLGGKIADNNPSLKTLSFLLFLSAILIAATAILSTPCLSLLSSFGLDLRISAVVSSLILFAPASVVFGMISPYAVRLKIKNVKNSGRTVGNLYAISTIGSIFGTFLAGFVLISFFGSTKILFLLAALMVFTSMLAYMKSLFKSKVLAVVVITLFYASSVYMAADLKQKGFIDVDTNYSRVVIATHEDPKTHKPIRTMSFDPLVTQSGMFLDSDELVFEYSKYFLLAKYFNKDIHNSLMLGGAGYSFPKYYLKEFGGARMDVVEIDSQITQLAREYFRLGNSKSLKIYDEDGRSFLNRRADLHGTYDAIFVDAYSSASTVPFQLTTVEAALKMHELMDAKGVLLVNLISAVSGPNSRFLEAEYATLKAVFPNVYVFPVGKTPQEVQSVILVALKNGQEPLISRDDEAEFPYLNRKWNGGLGRGMVLTDDFAPVEKLQAHVIYD